MRYPVALSALALLPAAAPAQVPTLPADGTVLDIRAEGRVSRVPDLATVRAGVVTQAPTASAAMLENASRVVSIIATLRGAGIAERDLSTASISLQPQYRYTEGQPPALTGYQASNTVSVRFHDIARAGRILDALVAQGANQIDGPNLSLDNPDAALDEARADAVKRARARADLYARAAGLRVVRMASIAEASEETGGSPPPVMYRLRAADASGVPTPMLPGQTDVTATLSVRFLLQ